MFSPQLYLYGGRPEHYQGCFTDLWEMDARAVLRNETVGGGGWRLLWKTETSCDPTTQVSRVLSCAEVDATITTTCHRHEPSSSS